MTPMTDFTLEFHSEAPLTDQVEAELVDEATTRIEALRAGHKDIIDASIAVNEVTGDQTPHRYEVRIVVYMRPNNVVAREKHENVEGALKQALSAIERQVREYRAKLREQSR